MALGRQVAPHIRKKGEELMPKSMKSEKSKSTLDGVIEVAASGLQGKPMMIVFRKPCVVFMEMICRLTYAVMDSMSACLACAHHQCYNASSSLSWGLNFP